MLSVVDTKQNKSVRNCRDKRADAVIDDIIDKNFLFIVSDCSIEKIRCAGVDGSSQPMPFDTKPILNLDIFELNNVLRKEDDENSVTTMQYDNTTPNQTILGVMQALNSKYDEELMAFNNNKKEPPPSTGCQFIASKKKDNDSLYLPCVNQAIGLIFLNSFSNLNKFEGLTPNIYFVKRNTLLRMICDPNLYNRAVSFTVNNFKYVYSCNDGDLTRILCSNGHPNFSSGTQHVDKSQWHHMMDFFTKLATEKDVHMYPPVTAIRQFDDKLLMKKMLGNLTLPYSVVTLPIFSKGHKWWKAITWTELYEYLITTYPFDNITKTDLKGIVLKPRYGAQGNHVIILENKLCEVSSNDGSGSSTTKIVIARLANDEIAEKPMKWLDWYKDALGCDHYLMEPYCPVLEKMEHRIIYRVPKKGSSLKHIAQTQANYEFESHKVAWTSVSSNMNTVNKFGVNNLSAKLFPYLIKNPDGRSVNGIKGLVYRIDLFEQKDYSDIQTEVGVKWMINEMHLVPISQTFITDYTTQEGILNDIADAYAEYIYFNYSPYYPA
jgi:hypothetical protein